MQLRCQNTPQLPDWLEVGTGDGPFLVIAPHGGAKAATSPSRPRLRQRRSRINDLHTAEVARRLTARLGASRIINHAMDRNQLDLNRISQVHSKAPWLLEWIAKLIDPVVQRGETVRILVVHGWNVNQSRCDLGIGAKVDPAALVVEGLTVSETFLRERLLPLTDLGDALVTLGDRYPARHHNNLLQLFRRDASRADETPAPLARAIREGRCDAVQLELGIPLRWPGRRRDSFLEQLSQAMLGRAVPGTTKPRSSNRANAASLQVFDRAAGLTMLASVDQFPGNGPCFGRLVLFLPDGRVALSTGEAVDLEQLARDGPIFSTTPSALSFGFAGSMLITDGGDDYVDLELALSRGKLADARIDLRCDTGDAAHGVATGTVRVDGAEIEVAATGFTTPRGWGTWSRAGRSQLSLRACFADGEVAVLRSGRGASQLQVAFDDDGYSPTGMTLASDGRSVAIRPLNRMAIARPVGKRRRARVTFGPAEVEVEGTRLDGTGIYEYARLIDR